MIHPAVSVLLVTRITVAQIVFPDTPPNSDSSSPPDQSSCVPLHQCGPLNIMWESRYIRRNTIEALAALQSAHCGFSGSSHLPLFRCHEQPRNEISRHMITDGGFDTPPCSGSVKLFNDEDAEPELVVTNSRSKVRVAMDRVVVEGNCCWRLHTKKRFRGRSLTVRAGASHATLETVRSIKKLEQCPVI